MMKGSWKRTAGEVFQEKGFWIRAPLKDLLAKGWTEEELLEENCQEWLLKKD